MTSQTETIPFKVHPLSVIRILLEHYFCDELYQFNLEEFEKEYKTLNYRIPKPLIYAINSFIQNLTEEQVDKITKQVTSATNITVDKAFIRDFFDAMITHPAFEQHCMEHVEENLEREPIFDYAVFDKTTKQLYQVPGLGEHSQTIKNILRRHPELDTLDKQNDFIMQDLVLLGNFYGGPSAYTVHRHQPPKYSLDEYYERLYRFNPVATIQKIVTDINAKETLRPEDKIYNYVIIDNHHEDWSDNDYALFKNSREEDFIRDLVTYNLLEAIPDNLIEKYHNLLELFPSRDADNHYELNFLDVRQFPIIFNTDQSYPTAKTLALTDIV